MSSTSGEITTKCCPFIEITWIVPDFFHLPTNVHYYFKSPFFHFAEGKWCLCINPNDTATYGTLGHIDINLERVDSRIPQQRITCRCGFKTRDGKDVAKFTGSSSVGPSSTRTQIFSAWRTEINVDGRKFVSDGSVTVFCEIRASTPSSPAQSPGSYPHQERHEASSQTEMLDSSTQVERQGTSGVQKQQLDYKKLLLSGEDSDVCLKVCDKEFPAHKCILRARSEVFSSMFKHDMIEKNSGKVVIEDLHLDSFPGFLQHLYTGRVDLTDDNAFHLYSAADKYDMPDLKSECRNHIQQSLSVDTFTDVMILAKRYREEDLLKLAVDFFKNNLRKIIVTVKWQKFLKEYDTEANELFIKALVLDDNQPVNEL